ncbi:MAG: hypothetical protein MJ252_02005 [archaeon]|nr:hypothetical protein [archaeon]
MEKMKKNPIHSNGYNYFIKDFIFIYFSLKKLASVCYKYKQSSKFPSTINDIKAEFIKKFKDSISENFSRAFTLVKNIERTADANGNFEKENIVNVHIIEHLVDYIKKMSQSFLDIYDEFYNENDINFFSSEDILIKELRAAFQEEIIKNYFDSIFSKLEQVLMTLNEGSSSKDMLLIQKFFYFYYIIYKLNDVFQSFQNSNVSYLVNDELIENLNEKLNSYMSSFYILFLNRTSIKILLMNRDQFHYYNEFIEDVLSKTKLFFRTENYNNNRAFEKPVMKFLIYLYCLCAVLLLSMNGQIDFEAFDNFLNDITDLTQIFFRLNSNDIIIKLHEFVKMLSHMTSEEDINNCFGDQTQLSDCRRFLIKFKELCLNEETLIKKLSEVNISIDKFVKISALNLLEFMKIWFEYKIIEKEPGKESENEDLIKVKSLFDD